MIYSVASVLLAFGSGMRETVKQFIVVPTRATALETITPLEGQVREMLGMKGRILLG